MGKIKCFLLDHQISSVERLKFVLSLMEQVEVVGEVYNPEKGIDLILGLKPELIFVGVELSGISGFEVLQEIHRNLFFPKFIFVTPHNQYAIKAIRMGAFDYLLTPIDFEILKDSLQRFKETQKMPVLKTKNFQMHKECFQETNFLELI